MNENVQVAQVVYDVIDELNAQLNHEGRLTKSHDTVLHGETGGLDSLGLVNLIVGVEEEIEERTGVMLSLVDELIVFTEESPFRTVGALIEYVAGILNHRARS